MEERNIKLVAIGDGAIGKTCLLMSFAHNHFPKEYVPTVFDNYNKEYMFENGKYFYHLWDTAGQEDYDRLRPMSYSDTKIFLILYSVASRTSYENVTSKWYKELETLGYLDVPRMLVGTKVDLRSDPKFVREMEEVKGKKLVTTEEGEKLRKEIGAIGFIECSALKYKNVNEIFEHILKYLLAKKKEKEAKDGGGGKGGLFASISGGDQMEEDVKNITKGKK